jgi:hypothetical protein
MRVGWRGFYAVIVLTLCLLFGSVATAAAFSARHHGIPNAAFAGLTALFFWYAAAVLVLQWIQSRQHQRAISALGFVPFDWEQVPIRQVVASVFASGRKAFFSRGCHGQIHSADVYVFDYGSDVAWWSKQGTAAVLVRPHDSPIAEKAVQLLRENANSELVITPTWLVVRSRRRVSPDMLGRWATTVVDTLKNG